MSMLACSICFEDLKDPVSIPCGHIYCDRCVKEYIQSSQDPMKASCPTCRTEFHIVSPDRNLVPEKCHPFLNTSVRRIYIETPVLKPYLERIAQLETRVTTLTESNAGLSTRVTSLSKDKASLMDRCEAAMEANRVMGLKEKEARGRAEEVNGKYEQMKAKYEDMKHKYEQAKPANADRTPPMPHTTSRYVLAAALESRRASKRKMLDDDSVADVSARDRLPLPRFMCNAKRAKLDAEAKLASGSRTHHAHLSFATAPRPITVNGVPHIIRRPSTQPEAGHPPRPITVNGAPHIIRRAPSSQPEAGPSTRTETPRLQARGIPLPLPRLRVRRASHPLPPPPPPLNLARLREVMLNNGFLTNGRVIGGDNGA
ncbi:uncharacterized protein STEHIDRAFT_126017 [Stereum hirsutum FP-91666 SS1]|uniref:RING-type domain-containing protein n=1 Tax=Stereum hirsutum (strain FP-91666) TaxID=721885 RepID=R7RYK5_STEHR|nr:uncharacterized protein STEHIDRAFT_126017 [Stereum hirsutum FP-91666 SS1]EIM80491.1 hypothetical protein STEHIDRAFT_126017 [Stereum hirsutum FP-91666 SS1]